MKNTTPSKLKIGFVFDDSLDRSDGVQQYVKTLGAWLSSNGHQVSYLVGETKIENWQNGKVFSLAKNIKVSFNGNKLSIPLPASKSSIAKVLKSQEFDVLHVQTPYSPLMAGKVIKNADKSTAVVGTFHILPVGWFQTAGTNLLRIWCYRSLKRFNKFFAVSSSAQVFAQDSFRVKSIVLPNVVDVARFKSLVEPGGSKYTIVFLGRLVDRKGCEHLIRAVGILNKSITNFELLIGGSGPQIDKLKQLCIELNIQDKVRFLGFVDEDDKADLLASAHIACFPSLYGESFGIVLIEAMASGSLVVLGGNNPGYASVLADSPHQLFDPKNHTTLANLLQKNLEDIELQQKTTQWQNDYVKRFDVNFVGEQLVSQYQQAVENQRLTTHNSSQ